MFSKTSADISRPHCQAVPVTLPSGSLKVALTAVPSSGELELKFTVPSSSMLATVILTFKLAVVLVLSRPSTLTS